MPSNRTILRQALEQHLLDRVRKGEHFHKSKFLEDAIEEGSVKQIGLEMHALQDNSNVLDIEKWGGNSDGTTWYVTLADSD